MHRFDDRPLNEMREPVMLLFIGIVILLISFFVVMNHSASKETSRAQAVMRGVVTSFDPQSPAAGRFTSNLGEAPGGAALQDNLGKLVATAFPLARMAVIQPGRVFVVELPLGNMWIEDEVEPTDTGHQFIVAVAKLLAEPQMGAVYDLDARLVAHPEMPHTLAVARVAAFGDALEANGAPSGAVATGVDSGRRDRLRLIFTLHEAADGRG